MITQTRYCDWEYSFHELHCFHRQSSLDRIRPEPKPSLLWFFLHLYFDFSCSPRIYDNLINQRFCWPKENESIVSHSNKRVSARHLITLLLLLVKSVLSHRPLIKCQPNDADFFFSKTNETLQRSDLCERVTRKQSHASSTLRRGIRHRAPQSGEGILHFYLSRQIFCEFRKSSCHQVDKFFSRQRRNSARTGFTMRRLKICPGVNFNIDSRLFRRPHPKFHPPKDAAPAAPVAPIVSFSKQALRLVTGRAVFMG